MRFKWLFGKWPLTQTQGLPTVGSAIHRGRGLSHTPPTCRGRALCLSSPHPSTVRHGLLGDSHATPSKPPHLISIVSCDPGTVFPDLMGKPPSLGQGRQQVVVPGLGEADTALRPACQAAHASATVAPGCALSVPLHETLLTTRGQAFGLSGHILEPSSPPHPHSHLHDGEIHSPPLARR